MRVPGSLVSQCHDASHDGAGQAGAANAVLRVLDGAVWECLGLTDQVPGVGIGKGSDIGNGSTGAALGREHGGWHDTTLVGRLCEDTADSTTCTVDPGTRRGR